MKYYTSVRLIDGKPRKVIVDETGKIINRNPSKEELKGIEKEIQTPYSRGNKQKVKSCCICNHNTYIDPRGYEIWFTHKCQKAVCTKYICVSCYQKYDPNSQHNLIKSVQNFRTGNLDPNCTTSKGKKSQKLACRLYGWVDLNEENDNYCSSLDCYDPKTGLYHQVQMRYYNPIEKFWPFSGFEDEWKKIFEDMIFFCFSKDGKIVERIYKFPWKEIMRVKSIKINNNGDRHYYDKYIIKDEDEINRANEIWKEIIKEM